jgi:hypothetical protein
MDRSNEYMLHQMRRRVSRRLDETEEVGCGSWCKPRSMHVRIPTPMRYQASRDEGLRFANWMRNNIDCTPATVLGRLMDSRKRRAVWNSESALLKMTLLELDDNEEADMARTIETVKAL